MRKKEILLALGIFAIFLQAAFSSWVPSTTAEFKVSPPTVYINWTDASGLGTYTANISVNNTKTYNITIEILNSSKEAILAPVFDVDVINISYCYFPGDNDGGSDKYPCINLSIIPSNVFLVENKTVQNLTLKPSYLFLQYPGRYKTFVNLTIINQTNSSENANISIFIDIPINFTYFGNRTTKIGKFDIHGNDFIYEIKSNNQGKEDAHFYYLNASEIENASAVFVNISDSKLTMFLFDKNENTLLASSYNTTQGEHELIYSPSSMPSDFLKLIIYGNDSSAISYEAYVSVFTIHALNASKDGVFGYRTIEINTSSDENNYTSVFFLENKGKYNYTNVAESKKHYLVYEFSGNGNSSYTFVVPANTDKIEAEFLWSSGNYSISLVNTSGDAVTSKYYAKNDYEIITQKKKLDLEYSSGISSGKWEIKVVNETSSYSQFNLTVKVFLPNSWVTTNYSSYSQNFLEAGLQNSSKALNFSFVLPSYAIPGDYKTELSYRENSGNGAGIVVPLKFKVYGASALINGKFAQDEIAAKQNLKRNLEFNISFTVSNYGNQNITSVKITFTNLTHGSNYTNITGIYVNDVAYSSGFSIPSNSSVEIKVQIKINESKATQEGIYQGEVVLNMSESSFKVIPYNYVKAILKLNMTKELLGEIISTDPSYLNVTGTSRNTTIVFKAYYANSSAIQGEINLGNITSVRLIHKNVTFYYKDLTSTKELSSTGSSNIWYGTPEFVYKFNVTIPQNLPGGYYTLAFNFTPSDTSLLRGSASKIIPVEGEAFYISVQTCPSSMQNGTQSWLNFTIWNYGLNTSSGKIKVYSTNSLISNFDKIETNCSISPESEGSEYQANISSLSPQKGCRIALKLTASSSSGSGQIKIDGIQGRWFANYSNSLTVSAQTSSSSSQTQTTTTTEQQQTQETQENESAVWINDFEFISYPSLISIEQGKSKSVSVSVRNTGNFTLSNLTLVVEGVESSWVKVSKPVSLAKDDTHTFTVNFTIPKNASLGKKEITFKVFSGNITKTAKATLEILPSEEYKTEIEQNLTLAKEIYQNLTSLYSEYVEKGIENETINSTLASIESLLSQAESLIKSNDYGSAASILSTALKLLQEAKEQISSLEEIVEKKEKENTLMILGIVLLIFGGGLLVYLLLPPPHGYEPEKGFRYVPPHHRGRPKIKKLVEEIKHKIREIKRKFSKQP